MALLRSAACRCGAFEKTLRAPRVGSVAIPFATLPHNLTVALPLLENFITNDLFVGGRLRWTRGYLSKEAT